MDARFRQARISCDVKSTDGSRHGPARGCLKCRPLGGVAEVSISWFQPWFQPWFRPKRTAGDSVSNGNVRLFFDGLSLPLLWIFSLPGRLTSTTCGEKKGALRSIST